MNMSFAKDHALEMQEKYGISISSRKDKDNELVEMTAFVQECALNKVEHYIKSLFYDSKSSCCVIETEDIVKEGDPVEMMLYECARKHIIQFELFGVIGHREDCEGSGMDDDETLTLDADTMLKMKMVGNN